jgi:hypothetical protein
MIKQDQQIACGSEIPVTNTSSHFLTKKKTTRVATLQSSIVNLPDAPSGGTLGSPYNGSSRSLPGHRAQYLRLLTVALKIYEIAEAVFNLKLYQSGTGRLTAGLAVYNNMAQITQSGSYRNFEYLNKTKTFFLLLVKSSSTTFCDFLLQIEQLTVAPAAT